MERLGGPVWHVSAQHPAGQQAGLDACYAALEDVGDPAKGEWVEEGVRWPLMHIKRRLSDAEDELVGGIKDLRNTKEQRLRVRELLIAAPNLRGYVLAGLKDGNL